MTSINIPIKSEGIVNEKVTVHRIMQEKAATTL